SFQLSIEVRQFFHDWKKYLMSFWNLFAISLLKDGSAAVWALAISNFLLDIKFLLFFRVFESFSGYFGIFFGVAKSLVSFFVFRVSYRKEEMFFNERYISIFRGQRKLDSMERSDDNNFLWIGWHFHNYLSLESTHQVTERRSTSRQGTRVISRLQD
ncbi:2976_t:CDS:2, partial [Acaulospora morrowiae]